MQADSTVSAVGTVHMRDVRVLRSPSVERWRGRMFQAQPYLFIAGDEAATRVRVSAG
jgi:hypothetical protein